MVNSRFQIVLVPSVAVVLSAGICLYADRVTRNAPTYPWHTATALEQACYWLLIPGVLMATVLPHHPPDSFEDAPPVSLVALVVGVSIISWSVFLTSLYSITHYGLRRARAKPTI